MGRLNGKWVFLLAITSAAAFHCGEPGPKISVDLNFRNLCDEFNVSGEVEKRCENPENCPQCDGDPNCIPFSCWKSPEVYYLKGFCRQCENNGNCPEGLPQCDHGWCHKTCSSSSECTPPYVCVPTSNEVKICRKPHTQGTTISFCNTGDQDLEVYVDKTELHGNADACAFSRYVWEPADQTTVVLAPDSCELFLNVMYTPPDVGEFRGFINVFSNASNLSPLPILFCANALEAKYEASIDDKEKAPDCASCKEEDFKQLMEQNPTPSCANP